MLFIYISIFFYLILSSLSFFFVFKKWNKKNHILLNIFYGITLLIPYPIEYMIEKMVRSKYNKITPIILKKLQDENIKFHIVFGTFLFAYRNKNFSDIDIDIAIYREDFSEQTKKSLSDLGFELKEEWYLDEQLSEQTYSHKKYNISMDIFHMSKESGFAPIFDEKNNRYSRRPQKYKYNLKELKINDVKVMGPQKPEEYLKWNYGNWKDKDSNYHWFYGSSSSSTIIVENANIKYKKYK